MSEDRIRGEMADLRRSKKPDQTDEAKGENDKAQDAREARMAKMANKEGGKSVPPAKASTPEAGTNVPPALAEHTVVSGDTLTHIAKKYYNSTERDKWMSIYEANKEIIGDNPSLIRVGQVLKIPTLSD